MCVFMPVEALSKECVCHWLSNPSLSWDRPASYILHLDCIFLTVDTILCANLMGRWKALRAYEPVAVYETLSHRLNIPAGARNIRMPFFCIPVTYSKIPSVAVMPSCDDDTTDKA
jgi:hypothetical protein